MMSTAAPMEHCVVPATSPRSLEFEEAAKNILLGDDATAIAFLRQGWISAAIEALVRARRRRGLSQREVGAQLGLHQSAIARLENDDEGHITLSRYVDYALALGALPYEIELAGLVQLRTVAATDPAMPRTVAACQQLFHEMLADQNTASATTQAGGATLAGATSAAGQRTVTGTQQGAAA